MLEKQRCAWFRRQKTWFLFPCRVVNIWKRILGQALAKDANEISASLRRFAVTHQRNRERSGERSIEPLAHPCD